MKPNDTGPRRMRRHSQGTPSRQPKPKRWRLTMVAGPNQDPADEPRMERMVVDLITVDPDPRALAGYAFSPWLSDGFLVIASIEPLTDRPSWVSEVTGVTRADVAELAEYLGFGDMLKKNSQKG